MDYITEHIKNIIYPWKKDDNSIADSNKDYVIIGTKSNKILMGGISPPLSEEYIVIIADIMSKLLSLREVYNDNLFKLLKEAANIDNNIYTENLQFISCMSDIRQISSDEEFNQYMATNRELFNDNPELERDVVCAFLSKKNVIHLSFKSELFQKDLNDFVSSKKNSELTSECIWNVSLFVIKTFHKYIHLL